MEVKVERIGNRVFITVDGWTTGITAVNDEAAESAILAILRTVDRVRKYERRDQDTEKCR